MTEDSGRGCMIPRMWLPVAVFFAGMACIAAAVVTGEAEVDLIVIFPVFSGSSGLFLLGTVLIIMSFLIGFAVLAMSQAELATNMALPSTSQKPTVEKKTQYGGVVLIGPLPIAFGSDRRIAVIMLVLGIAMAIALISVLLMLG